MYKVLLVDDEIINYQLFEKLVNWKEKGFEIIGTASDGLEALQKYEKLSPDLIFMDIQMPLMDGLECVRCIREEDHDTKIVIVSAFDDFSYAQKAIRYGVQDYLLKPLSRLILNQLVDKLREELDASKTSQEKAEKESFFENDCARALSAILQGKEDVLLPSVAGKQITAFTITDESGCFISGGEQKEIIEKMFRDFSQNVAVGLNGNGVACVVCEEGHGQIQSLIKRYCETISCKTQIYPYMAGQMEPEEWFRLLKDQESYGFYEKKSGTYQLQNDYFSKQEMPFGNAWKIISEGIADNSPEKIIKYLEEVFREAGTKQMDPGILKEAVFDFLIQIKFMLKQFEMKDSFSVMRNVMPETIHGFQDSDRLYSWLIDKINQTFQEIDQAFFGPGRRLVLRTNAFVEVSYADPAFSVQDAADYNGISKNYFTGLYKEQAGIGFWEYVTNRRMEKAKELLMTTDELINVVAGMVGYESEFHFSRKFKEYTGESPNRFRKNLRK